MPLGPKTRRSARENRWGLGLLGVLLVGAGSVALAAGLGVFGAGYAQSPLVGPAALDALRQPWVPYAGAGVAVVVVLVAARWLLVQGRTDTTARLRVEGDNAQGFTDISASAVRGVLEDRVNRYPAVHRARVRLTGSWRAPGVLLDVVLDTDADAAAVWRRIRREEMARLRDSLELDTLPAVVRMSMSAPAKSRPRGLR